MGTIKSCNQGRRTGGKSGTDYPGAQSGGWGPSKTLKLKVCFYLDFFSSK